jgi:hypothetical protein
MRLDPDEFVQSDPVARLERAFIAEFLERHGHSAATLHELPEAEANALMREASVYASAKLSEVEARAHYVHDIHDASRRHE